MGQNCVVLPFLSDIILQARGGDHRDFMHFPVGRMSNKRPKPSFRVSPSPIALGRNRSARGQAPGEKSSGHAIPSLPPFPFLVFASWGTGRSHDQRSARGFISYKCSIPAPQLRKKCHYTRQYFEHTLKFCPEHRWTSAHV